jgi:amino acid transporter
LPTIYRATTGSSAVLVTTAGIFAVLNGALIQTIMASRVLYGMAEQGWAPKRFAKVHHRTRTPLMATALVASLILALALFVPLVALARITSTVVLLTFALVNFALWRLKRHPPPRPNLLSLPRWIPAVGAAVSMLFAALQIAEFLNALA